VAATVRDIARRAAVSSGTVSRVLNNHANIDEDLRRRVLHAAADLGYARRGRGRPATRRVDLREIGFFMSLPHRKVGGDLLGPFWAHILHGAEQQARTYGARITYRPIRNPEPAAMRTEIGRLAPDAALLVGATPEALIREALRAEIPVCLVDNAVPGLDVDAVLSDNFWGARTAVDHLLALGHRRVAFIGGPRMPGVPWVSTIYTLDWRAAGYVDALQRAGIPVDDSLGDSCDLTPSGGYEACQRLLASGQRFSAVFCGNDPTAVGVLKALREAGLRVPEDVSVIGFDDDLADHTAPPLTTIRVDKEEMGAAAVRRLRDRVLEPETATATLTLGVRLVERDSVTRPRPEGGTT
jgi:LacI family transcriptional regulator, galactose operon repressor